MNGYIAIDCEGLDLIKGSTPQTLDGIYDDVTTAMKTGKPIYAYNCNWDGRYVTPIQIFAINFSNTIICTASTLQILINSNDTITINNLVG